MKQSDAKRVAMLCRAMDMSQVLRDLKQTRPGRGYERRALEIQVADCSDSGGTSNGGIEVDIVTARKLMPMIRALIKVELKSLGVELKADLK